MKKGLSLKGHSESIFYAALNVVIIIYLTNYQIIAQIPNNLEFDNPLKDELRLSGNFGELRGGHFHAGLDIKTNGMIGKPVYAAEDGYVSRLKVAYFGYGKALYLTHKGGYSTVYCHLDRFSDQIQNHIKLIQYKKERYQVELFPSKNEFIIKKGEIIGYTGNTGSSGGPHLHFEIRDPQSRPLNPFNYGIEVSDNKPPRPTVLRWYPYKDYGLNTEIYGQNLSLTEVKPNEFLAQGITAFGLIGFGIGVYDQQDGSSNKNGIYQIKTKLNDSLIQNIVFDRFSFKESKFMNRYIDYRHYSQKRQRVHKLFRASNNPLGIIKNSQSEGLVMIESGTYTYRIELIDHAGNTTTIKVPIVGRQPKTDTTSQSQSTVIETERDMQCLTKIPWSSATSWSDGYYSISFPRGCFYESTTLDLSVDSDILHMDQDLYPVYKRIKITYSANHLSREKLSHAYIARLNGSGIPTYENTSRVGNTLEAKVKTLGNYGVYFDETPPEVSLDKPSENEWFSDAKKLKVIIKDGESGIGNYKATINGRFILMEYDYKTNSLTYDFSDRIIKEAPHNFKLVVNDNAGNSTTFERLFYRRSND